MTRGQEVVELKPYKVEKTYQNIGYGRSKIQVYNELFELEIMTRVEGAIGQYVVYRCLTD